MDFTTMGHEELVHTLMKVTSLLDGIDFEAMVGDFIKEEKPLNHEAESLTDALGMTRERLDELDSLATGLVSETLITSTRSKRIEWLHLRWKRMSSIEKAFVAVKAVELAFFLFAKRVKSLLEELSTNAGS